MKFSTPLMILVILLFSAACRSSRQAGQGSGPESIFSHEPSSRNPNGYAEAEGPQKSNKVFGKNSFTKRLDQKVEEYEERMEENEKKYRKRAREMKKPQYSDFSYFGHKRKPKKRPVGKRKLCKECGIVH